MADTSVQGEGRRGALPAWPWKLVKLGATVALTFLGLLLVTFLIGRVMPIDTVLAVVGERATNVAGLGSFTDDQASGAAESFR